MFGKFLKEEKGQGAIEYILLVGGILIAAVIIFVLYTRMVKQSALEANKTYECGKLNETDCGNDPDCTWDTTYNYCRAK